MIKDCPGLRELLWCPEREHKAVAYPAMFPRCPEPPLQPSKNKKTHIHDLSIHHTS